MKRFQSRSRSEEHVSQTRETRSNHSGWKRCLLGVTLLAGLMTSVGCFVPIYSARPERRVQQLLYTSEDMRSIVEEWERFWFLDSPSHMTPIRTHGGIF